MERAWDTNGGHGKGDTNEFKINPKKNTIN